MQDLLLVFEQRAVYGRCGLFQQRRRQGPWVTLQAKPEHDGQA